MSVGRCGLPGPVVGVGHVGQDGQHTERRGDGSDALCSRAEVSANGAGKSLVSK